MIKIWKLRVLILLPIFMMPFTPVNSGLVNSGNKFEPGFQRFITIEDFDSGVVNLESYPGEDEDPLDWELNATITYGNSTWSLKLFGNTWKLQNIDPVTVDTGDVWQVSAYIQTEAEIQGFGIMDSINVFYYAFAGSQEVNVDDWIPVYQGSFPENQWNIYKLPVADDWISYFGYLPKITSLVYINDKDASSQGVVYFDNVINISNDLPVIPDVSIEYNRGNIYKNSLGVKVVDIQFMGKVIDPDSEEHEFFWDFGDESYSTEQNPQHTFLIHDDHPYTVLLEVADNTNRWGQASCSIEVDPGSSSFPITINFVGDIMLARKYEYPGGIIPTQGVEAIFEPTRTILGDAADITVANLECPLTTHWEHHPTKSIYFKGSPANVTGLTYAGIDIVTLANNHTMDYLEPGMIETQSVLNENNIIYSGCGASSYEAYRPAFYSKSGVTFGFLASSDRTGQYNNAQPFLNAGYNKPGFGNLTEYYIKKQIDEIRDISDLVVMEFHTGVEYSFEPKNENGSELPFAGDSKDEEDYNPLETAPDERGMAIRKFAIDNGADLVICHHPHIAQGLELYDGKLIAHSLGDFVFDLDYPETFPTFILTGKVNETGFYEFSLTPIYIDDYIPQRAEGGLGLHILDYIAQCSRDLDTYLKIDRETVTATVIMDAVNMPSYQVETDVELPMEQTNGIWETELYTIERSGSISSVTVTQPSGDFQFRLGREEIWFGNMENEGCTLWNLNNADESFCDTVYFAGERSIQHYRDAFSPSNIVTNFEQKIICPSDTINYSLCGYIKTQNGANVTLQIQYYADRIGGIMLGQENVATLINGNTPWTFYQKQLTIPAGTEFFDVRMSSGVPDAGIALSWFDEVSLVKWEDYGKYDISEDIPTPNDYYFIQVKSMESTDEIVLNFSETIYDELPVGVTNPAKEEIALCTLKQNFPNPFNPVAGPTTISFNLENPADVNISVFDIKGQRVKVLTDQHFQSGIHNLSWDGTNIEGRIVGSGVYFYQLETQGLKQIQKCVLLR